jgi:hypothetical protein
MVPNPVYPDLLGTGSYLPDLISNKLGMFKK